MNSLSHDIEVIHTFKSFYFKIESKSEITIVGLKMEVKSGLHKMFLKSLNAGSICSFWAKVFPLPRIRENEEEFQKKSHF